MTILEIAAIARWGQAARAIATNRCWCCLQRRGQRELVDGCGECGQRFHPALCLRCLAWLHRPQCQRLHAQVGPQ